MSEQAQAKVVYDVVGLDEVMRFYADAYQADVRYAEWFVDPAKSRVVFRLLVASPTPPGPTGRPDTPVRAAASEGARPGGMPASGGGE